MVSDEKSGSSKSVIVEESKLQMAVEKIPASASMKDVLTPHGLSEELQSSKNKKSSVPNDSYSADRIEEYKGIRMLPLVEEESEPVDEDSEPNEEDS